MIAAARSAWRRWLIALLATSLAPPAAADPLDDYLFADLEALGNGTPLDLPDPPERSWLEDPEMRISPERDVREQRTETYSLRFRPTTRRERATSQQLFATENELTAIDWDRALSNALADRYLQVVELADLEARLAVASGQVALDRSLLDVERALSAASNFSADRLLNAVLRLERSERELARLAARVDRLRHATVAGYLAVAGEGGATISDRLVGPAAIGGMVEQVSAAVPTSSHVGKLAQLELRRARQEMELAQTRGGFGLELLEFSYENKGFDSYNVTMGFRLPFARRSGASRRGAREFVAARESARLAERLLAESVQANVRSILANIAAYDADSAALRRLDARLTSASLDAAGIVVLRRHRLALRESIAATHIRVLRDFVDLLNAAGLLRQRPQRNWLRGNRT